MRFAPMVWAWRGWDHEYSYDLFLFGLGRTAVSIKKHRNHEEWMRDVGSINYLLEVWLAYRDSETLEDEERLWVRFHDHLKKDARRWWQ